MVDEWELFESYTDFFIFAAAVGYNVEDKQTVEQYTEEEFKGIEANSSARLQWVRISNQQSYRVISASLAYQHTNEYEVLTNPEKQLEILARYAKAGVVELANEFNDYTNPPRDGLISYIDNWTEADDAEGDDDEVFNEIIDSFDQDIFN
jgi:hypothetical protein